MFGVCDMFFACLFAALHRMSVLTSLFRDEAVFPADRYQSDSWLPFLCQIGLQDSISDEVFITCALKIQAMSTR